MTSINGRINNTRAKVPSTLSTSSNSPQKTAHIFNLGTQVICIQIVSTLTDCATDVIAWCAAKRLQLNADKTEVMWFGTAAKLSKIPLVDNSIRVGSTDIQPVTVVRDLGVMIDAELTMRDHVSRTARTCFYHLRRLRSIRRQLGRDVTARLVSALIIAPRLLQCSTRGPPGFHVGAVPESPPCSSSDPGSSAT